MEVLNHCGRRRITAVGPKSPKTVARYFLQYSKFASERAQVRTREWQTCFLPRAPSNLVTSLHNNHHHLSLTISILWVFWNVRMLNWVTSIVRKGSVLPRVRLETFQVFKFRNVSPHSN